MKELTSNETMDYYEKYLKEYKVFNKLDFEFFLSTELECSKHEIENPDEKLSNFIRSYSIDMCPVIDIKFNEIIQKLAEKKSEDIGYELFMQEVGGLPNILINEGYKNAIFIASKIINKLELEILEDTPDLSKLEDMYKLYSCELINEYVNFLPFKVRTLYFKYKISDNEIKSVDDVDLPFFSELIDYLGYYKCSRSFENEYTSGISMSNETKTFEIDLEKSQTVNDKYIIEGKYRFNSKNQSYMTDYLDDLDSFFHFESVKKMTFGAVCLAIYSKNIFNAQIDFKTLVETLSKYWNIEPPKDKHPNKYKVKKNELIKKYEILERKII